MIAIPVQNIHEMIIKQAVKYNINKQGYGCK